MNSLQKSFHRHCLPAAITAMECSSADACLPSIHASRGCSAKNTHLADIQGQDVVASTQRAPSEGHARRGQQQVAQAALRCEAGLEVLHLHCHGGGAALLPLLVLLHACLSCLWVQMQAHNKALSQMQIRGWLQHSSAQACKAAPEHWKLSPKKGEAGQAFMQRRSMAVRTQDDQLISA